MSRPCKIHGAYCLVCPSVWHCSWHLISFVFESWATKEMIVDWLSEISAGTWLTLNIIDKVLHNSEILHAVVCQISTLRRTLSKMSWASLHGRASFQSSTVMFHVYQIMAAGVHLMWSETSHDRCGKMVFMITVSNPWYRGIHIFDEIKWYFCKSKDFAFNMRVQNWNYFNAKQWGLFVRMRAKIAHS